MYQHWRSLRCYITRECPGSVRCALLRRAALQLVVALGGEFVDELHLYASLEVAFQNDLRLTVDFFRESWPYCRLWFQKLTDFDSCIIFLKIATVATSWLSTFRGFCCGFFYRISVGKWKNSYKMASKIFKNFRRSQQSTTWPIREVATVYVFFESWPTVVFFFKNPTTVDSWST